VGDYTGIGMPYFHPEAYTYGNKIGNSDPMEGGVSNKY
jgi:hypothetical protein